MSGTITMVTQEGTTITIPAHEAMLSPGEGHSVTMVSADGTEGQVFSSHLLPNSFKSLFPPQEVCNLYVHSFN